MKRVASRSSSVRVMVGLLGLAGIVGVVVMEVVAAEPVSGRIWDRSDLAAILRQREEGVASVYPDQGSPEVQSRFEEIRALRRRIEDNRTRTLRSAPQRRPELEAPAGAYDQGGRLRPFDLSIDNPDQVVRTVP